MIGPSRTMFTVHTDLLCAKSPFFRTKLQPNRRPIEDDCSICQDEVELGRQELTFCKSCGVNFHYRCIEEWKARAAEGEATTCPLCRQEWAQHRDFHGHLFSTINADAFETYFEWLYRSHIAVDDTGPDSSVVWDLFDAYLLGSRLEDWQFCSALLHAIIDFLVINDEYPDEKLVQHIYEKTSGPCPIRCFLVGLLVHLDQTDWLEEDTWAELPAEFLRDMTLALLKRNPPGEESWNEATLKARLCIAEVHAHEGE